MPPSGFSASSMSTNEESGREKRPNPSFKGARQAETITSKQVGNLNMEDQTVHGAMNAGSQQQGVNAGSQQQGLSREGWLRR
jgi:hypothetical protein